MDTSFVAEWATLVKKVSLPYITYIETLPKAILRCEKKLRLVL